MENNKQVYGYLDALKHSIMIFSFLSPLIVAAIFSWLTYKVPGIWIERVATISITQIVYIFLCFVLILTILTPLCAALLVRLKQGK